VQHSFSAADSGVHLCPTAQGLNALGPHKLSKSFKLMFKDWRLPIFKGICLSGALALMVLTALDSEVSVSINIDDILGAMSQKVRARTPSATPDFCVGSPVGGARVQGRPQFHQSQDIHGGHERRFVPAAPYPATGVSKPAPPRSRSSPPTRIFGEPRCTACFARTRRKLLTTV